MTPQLLHGLCDAFSWHLGGRKGLGGAKNDQILEREPPGVAGAPLGRHEPGLDQRPDRAARQVNQLLDVSHAVFVHGRTLLATS